MFIRIFSCAMKVSRKGLSIRYSSRSGILVSKRIRIISRVQGVGLLSRIFLLSGIIACLFVLVSSLVSSVTEASDHLARIE